MSLAFCFCCTGLDSKRRNGVPVEYDGSSGYLICPCHGATFDPGSQAQPIAGPTNIPLTSLPIKIDSKTGKITLVG